MAGIDSYRRSLRAAVRGYWSGVLSNDQFFEVTRSAIDRRLTQAFREGAAECGVKPDEFTPEELLELANAIQSELTHVPNLTALVDELKPRFPTRPKAPPPQVFNRVDLWVNRYGDLRSQAQQLACGDQKLEWMLNPQKENCGDCERLDGQVRRASVWEAADLRPYSHRLD